MNTVILLELAARWDRDARNPVCEDGSPEAERGNAIALGTRMGKTTCADELRSVIDMFK